ncbi:hypothetical protein [Methylocystis echinoides]|uniref:hypothetical protein n=1 Tax=Methylocystis echinoides TaxID=29468 RepID=UPI003418E1A4
MIRLQSEFAEAYRDISTKFADQPLVLPKAVASIPVFGPILDEAVTQVWNDPELRKEQLKDWLEPWVRELAGIVGRIGRTAVQLAVTTITLFFFYRDGELVLEQARRGLRKVAGEPADHYLKAVGDVDRQFNMDSPLIDIQRLS